MEDEQRQSMEFDSDDVEHTEELPEFTDLCVLVTGGSAGIGAATAKRFTELGAHVGIVGRNSKRLIEVAKDCANIPLVLEANLKKRSQIECVYRTFMERYNRIDILINCAGVIEGGSLLNTSMKQFDQTMFINLRAAFYLTHLCTPELIKSKGCIVNISSAAGKCPVPKLLAYCISKAALDQLTKCIALDLGPYGVRCNAVSPGQVGLPHDLRKGMKYEEVVAEIEASKRRSVLGRLGEVDEVVEAIIFLASKKSNYTTGAIFDVDGGRSIMVPRPVAFEAINWKKKKEEVAQAKKQPCRQPKWPAALA